MTWSSTAFFLFLLLACIGIASAAPASNFAGIPTNGASPLSVSFHDTSSGSPNGWTWFFGDEPFNQSWVRQNASPCYEVGYDHFPSLNVLPDGDIALVGALLGEESYYNDTLLSTDKGETWSQVGPSPDWSSRKEFISVVLPDGSIVLQGGYVDEYEESDYMTAETWRSEDKGTTWTMMNSSNEKNCTYEGIYDLFCVRGSHAGVALSDGSIVIMGGYTNANDTSNDVWRSTDSGATWTEMTPTVGYEYVDGYWVSNGTGGANWSGRYNFRSVALPDDSILVLGGYHTDYVYDNETWRSTDFGATWTLMNASSGWQPREGYGATVLPDGSIIVSGGEHTLRNYGPYNDTWRSTDKGATWSKVRDGDWEKRGYVDLETLPDGSVLFGGGYDYYGMLHYNDIWRWNPIGSSDQNPSHIYTGVSGQTFNVTLQAYNSAGYDAEIKPNYITLGGASPVTTIPTPITPPGTGVSGSGAGAGVATALVIGSLGLIVSGLIIIVKALQSILYQSRYNQAQDMLMPLIGGFAAVVMGGGMLLISYTIMNPLFNLAGV